MKKQLMAVAAFLITIITANAQSGNVGIGTNSPAAKLDINGNLIIRSAQTHTGSGVSAMVRDNVTGEVKVIGTAANTTPISYTEYVISNVNGDWLADYDTKIPTGSYVVSIVGSSFGNPAVPSGTFLTSLQSNTYNPLNVYADQSGGTWHLHADYVGGAPSTAYNGTWTIRVLIINSSMVKVLGNQNGNLGGSGTGSASGVPAGL